MEARITERLTAAINLRNLLRNMIMPAGRSRDGPGQEAMGQQGRRLHAKVTGRHLVPPQKVPPLPRGSVNATLEQAPRPESRAWKQGSLKPDRSDQPEEPDHAYAGRSRDGPGQEAMGQQGRRASRQGDFRYCSATKSPTAPAAGSVNATLEAGLATKAGAPGRGSKDHSPEVNAAINLRNLLRNLIMPAGRSRDGPGQEEDRVNRGCRLQRCWGHLGSVIHSPA